MRGLPDHPTDKKYPREEWIDQGNPPKDPKMTDAAASAASGPAPDLDQSGDYVNLEVAFAYSAQPGQSNELRSKNIHLLLEFFVGAFDWFNIPIPMWVQIESIVGTVRLRLQFIPEAPFIRNLTFTFMGVPAVEVSVTPMSKNLPNVLDLPLISTFVKMAIAAGVAEYVAPKSMTLNMQELLSGAAIGDTRAVGVFIITIHHAENLSIQDKSGTSFLLLTSYARLFRNL
jgi:Ca2+-dependent lipid-binding protein